MRSGKNGLRGKNDIKSKKGVLDGNRGHTVAGPSSTLSSDSDDDDVMHQLVPSPDHRTHATTSRAEVASLRNGIPDGPGSDSDNRGSGSGSSEDDDPRQRSSTRSARGVGTDSPATTPVGSPSQTPGLASSSSEDVPQQANGMNIDSEGPEPGLDALSNEVRTTELNVTERPFNISYIPCHTWPPCAVCARINGEPPPQVTTSSFMVVRQRQVTLARETGRNVAAAQSTSLTIHASASASTNQTSLCLPSLSRPPDAASARPEFMPPPTSPPPMPYDPPHPNRSRPTDPPRPEAVPTRMPASANGYPPLNYPMEPLFVSAGVAPQSGRGNTFRGGAPASGTGRGTAPPTIPHVIRQVTLSSVSAPVRHSPYARPQRNASAAANAQASSSSLRIEDMRGAQIGGERRLRGRGRQKSKKVRAKRYNRKKREEWPPEGWNPIWEEERPRRWEGYDIPDDVATDKVYDHLRRRFDLKSMGQCKWEGCIPTEASKDGYKMLKRHVETVHLGLKLVCKLCGVRKRADNRRKATHKRGCPEREDGPGDAPNGSASVGPSTDTAASASGGAAVQTKTAGKTKATDADGDTQMDDEEMNNDEEGQDGSDSGEGEGEEEDELEEDELEEDQLDEDQDEAGDQPMESEFESEDD